jgi:hypothetical protein
VKHVAADLGKYVLKSLKWLNYVGADVRHLYDLVRHENCVLSGLLSLESHPFGETYFIAFICRVEPCQDDYQIRGRISSLSNQRALSNNISH